MQNVGSEQVLTLTLKNRTVVQTLRSAADSMILLQVTETKIWRRFGALKASLGGVFGVRQEVLVQTNNKLKGS